MPERWDKIADIRHRQIESGIDITFSEVFLPYYAKLVGSLQPTSLLEVGCGTGHLSAALEKAVPSVVALEPSSGMHRVAQDVLRGTRVELLNFSIQDYRANRSFEMIISHMCAQVVDDLDSFLGSITSHMNGQSLLAVTIPHPCFYNEYKRLFAPGDYKYMCESRKTISFTITRDPLTRITGIPYSHRPLSTYFAHFKSYGLRVVNFEEIFPEPRIQGLYTAKWDAPRYCVFHVENP
jgi:trans-aconitate methyltransferase